MPIRQRLDRAMVVTSCTVPLVIQSYPTPQPTTFATHHVHRDLLAATSAWFHRQSESPGAWQTNAEGAICFKIYVDWLYTGNICSLEESPHVCEYIRLARLHSVGRSLEDVTFQTAVADALPEKVIEELANPEPSLPGPPCLQAAFSEAAASSPIQKIIAETYARHSSQEQVDVLLTQMGTQPAAQNFLQAYGQALRAIRLKNPPGMATLRGCRLYDHSAEEQCPLQAHARTQRRLDG